MHGIRSSFYRAGLVRADGGRVLGGVCAGLARKFGTSAMTMRIVFILAMVLIPGSQILIYPILWFLLPDEGFDPHRGNRAVSSPPPPPPVQSA